MVLTWKSPKFLFLVKDSSILKRELLLERNKKCKKSRSQGLLKAPNYGKKLSFWGKNVSNNFLVPGGCKGFKGRDGLLEA